MVYERKVLKSINSIYICALEELNEYESMNWFKKRKYKIEVDYYKNYLIKNIIKIKNDSLISTDFKSKALHNLLLHEFDQLEYKLFINSDILHPNKKPRLPIFGALSDDRLYLELMMLRKYGPRKYDLLKKWLVFISDN